jgi:hypothetical protein
MSKQPEAIRLAGLIVQYPTIDRLTRARDELRRLHASNAELLSALKYAHVALKDTADYRMGHPGVEQAAAKASAAIANATKEQE